MLKEISIKTNEILNSKKIDYCIIGRIAVACWGMPISTANMDIVLAIKENKINELLEEFIKARFVFSKEKTYKKLSEGKPAKLWYEDEFSIDLRIVKFTIDYEALKRAKAFKIWDKEWKIAPPEELIIYKLGRAKPKDWEDIKAILKNKTLRLDWRRMEWLSKTLEEEFEPNFFKRFEKLKKLKFQS
ncbi:MAG: nucleotidyltransferase [Candidatus Edwardsbacteria bacterium]